MIRQRFPDAPTDALSAPGVCEAPYVVATAALTADRVLGPIVVGQAAALGG